MEVDAHARRQREKADHEDEQPPAKHGRAAAASKEGTSEGPAAAVEGNKKGKTGEQKGKGKDNKKNKVEPPDEEEVSFNMAIKMLSKLSLNTAQQVRQLISAAFTTFLVLSSMALVKSAETEGKAYARTAKAEGRAALGPPHLHITAAVVDVTVEDKEFAKDQAEHHKVLAEVQQSLKNDLTKCPFTYFRVKPAYKKPDKEQQYKITWSIDPLATHCSVNPQALQKAMISYITTRCADAQLKLGPPPKGEVERAVERLLKKV